MLRACETVASVRGDVCSYILIQLYTLHARLSPVHSLRDDRRAASFVPDFDPSKYKVKARSAPPFLARRRRRKFWPRRPFSSKNAPKSLGEAIPQKPRLGLRLRALCSRRLLCLWPAAAAAASAMLLACQRPCGRARADCCTARPCHRTSSVSASHAAILRSSWARRRR